MQSYSRHCRSKKSHRRKNYGNVLLSPPLFVPNAPQTPKSLIPVFFGRAAVAATPLVRQLIVSLTKCTLPSTFAQFTPPV
jgi:hypothetical protein